MVKRLIALNPNNQDLSSADFNKGLEHYNQPNNYLKTVIDTLQRELAEAEKKRLAKREFERARTRGQEARTIQQGWKWKLKQADSLKLAYAILANQQARIEIDPRHFDLNAFISVVDENLNYVEKWLLWDKVSDMFEKLNERIDKINSYDNQSLYWQYHTHNPKALNYVTARYDGQPEYHYGVDEPTPELIEMEIENDILMNLSSQLDSITSTKPNQEELETYKQALEG